MRQSLQNKCLPDTRELRLRGAHEFPARRHIKKQIAHGNIRARRQAGIADLLNLAAKYQDFRSRHGPGPIRGQRELRNGRNRGQRFPSKTHRGDAVQIRQLPQLAGGMALNGQQSAFAIHAQPVIAHPHQTPTAIHHIHLNALGAGINRVFNQFLQHRRRPLNHLTGGNLVDYRVRQHSNGNGFGHALDFSKGASGTRAIFSAQRKIMDSDTPAPFSWATYGRNFPFLIFSGK